MPDYTTGTFKTYEAVHVIHLNLNGGQVPRKLSAGERCQFDGSTIILGDDTKYAYTEFRGAIQRGWARSVEESFQEVPPLPRRSISRADMTLGKSKHVPEIHQEDSREVRKVESSEAINLFLQDMKARLGPDPKPSPQPHQPHPQSKYGLDTGHTEIRSLSHLSPATPSEDHGRPMQKMAMEVHQEQRAVGTASSTRTPTMEDSARVMVTNPESISTRGAEVGAPQVSRMPDGSLRIEKKFKTPANPIVGDEPTPTSLANPEEPVTPIEHLIEMAKFATVRIFVPDFSWDKDRSPNERIKAALSVRDKNVLKGIMAVEDDLVRGKVAEALSQKVARQKGAAIKA